MSLIGIEFPLDSIINKWKKLKQQYKTHVDKKRKSGTERSKPWKFFDGMEEICGHRDIISPTALLDTSLSPPSKDDGDNSDMQGKVIKASSNQDFIIILLFVECSITDASPLKALLTPFQTIYLCTSSCQFRKCL